MVLGKRLGLLFLIFWVAGVGCKPETETGPAPEQEPATVAQHLTSILRFNTTDQGVSVTHLPSGQTHTLFEDETFEDSEEGTSHQLLSHFGPYVSYSQAWYYEGGAHPSYGKMYHAVVVGETLEEADLRSLFSEEALYAAMQQTALVKETPLSHTELDELIEGLAETYTCEMSFDRFFSSFFVRDVQEDVAEVVIGLTHGCEVLRGTFTTFVLKMNIVDIHKEHFSTLTTVTEE